MSEKESEMEFTETLLKREEEDGESGGVEQRNRWQLLVNLDWHCCSRVFGCQGLPERGGWEWREAESNRHCVYCHVLQFSVYYLESECSPWLSI